MNKELSLLGKIGGAMVIHFSPGSSTFESDGPFSRLYLNITDRLNRWYERNGSYRFKIGTKVKLKSRRFLGYGIKPEGKIIGYEEDTGFGHDLYIIDMEIYTGDDYEWAKNGKFPEDARKIRRTEKHFKRNVEHHFRRAA